MLKFHFFLVLALFCSTKSSATILTGNLASASDVATFTFSVLTISDVNIQTYQFGGLTGFVAPDGIDSVVSLFLGTGPNALLISFNDDGDCPPATLNSFCGDSTLHLSNVVVGDYTLAITANQSTPIGPTFGSGFDPPTGPLGSGSNYYVDLTTSSAVPEPSYWLAVGGIFLLFVIKRTRTWTTGILFMAGTYAMAAEFVVPAGGDFQSAILNAQSGDTITLQAGAVFTGNFTFPAKNGTAFVTIQTSSATLRNLSGIRVAPANVSQMATIVTANDTPAMDFAFGGHHYRFIGLEIRPTARYSLDLIRIGTYETSLSQVPHHIEFDRCYIHGDANLGGKRGISLNGIEVTIRNSYFADFKDVNQETQAIQGWNGPGPFHIINNHIEAAGIGIAFGGAIPFLVGNIPSDIEVRSNHFYKPLSWDPSDPSYAGTPWLVKYHFEVKFAQRIIFDGNVLDNSWYPPLAGRAIGLGVRTEGGAVPNAVIQDVMISRNIMRHLGAGILIFGRDESANNTGALRRVTVQDNLFIDIAESHSQPGSSTAGVLATVHTLTEDVRILHNTYVGSGRNIFLHFNQLGAGYRVENNLLQHNLQGISWGETLFNIDALNAVAPLDYTFRGNVIQGGSASRFPLGNYFPTPLDNIGYANLALRDLRLTAASPYYKQGTDGLDIGANAAAVYQATQGVVPNSQGFPLSGGRCITSLSSPPSTFTNNGGTGSITVTAPSGCTWMTIISSTWPTITGGFSGMGTGTVSFTVPPYTGAVVRATTVLVGGLKVVVSQNP